MVVKGLMKNNQSALADGIARNFLNNIADIYFNFKQNKERIPFEDVMMMITKHYGSVMHLKKTNLQQDGTIIFIPVRILLAGQV